jgi:hypothetical protein
MGVVLAVSRMQLMCMHARSSSLPEYSIVLAAAPLLPLVMSCAFCHPAAGFNKNTRAVARSSGSYMWHICRRCVYCCTACRALQETPASLPPATTAPLQQLP